MSKVVAITLCALYSAIVYIRLKDPILSYAGRVEISKDEKTWGTICDKYWTGNDANVTCIQLGFPFAVAAVPMAGFSAGTGSIFLKDVQCTGSEKSLLECEHDVWKTHDVNESCNHSMDVGVVCYPHKESNMLQNTVCFFFT